MRYTEWGRVRWAGRGGADSFGLNDRLRFTFSGSGGLTGTASVSPRAEEKTGEVRSDLSDSRLPPTIWESLFCFMENLKALIFTSGDENIGGLFAEANPEVCGPSTLPGDSG